MHPSSDHGAIRNLIVLFSDSFAVNIVILRLKLIEFNASYI